MKEDHNKSEKDKFIEEGGKFIDNTLMYLIENWQYIFLICLVIAIIGGLKSGCNAINTQ